MRKAKHFVSHNANGQKELYIGIVVVLLVVLIAVIFGGIVRSCRAQRPDEGDVLPHETQTEHEGFQVPLYDNVARNPYPAAQFAKNEAGRISYPGASLGVDVSSHQGAVDWPAVAADGVEWAIVRLGRRGYTEGGLFLDETFEANLTGAAAAGLDVGVYFFSQAITVEEAQEEARYVLDVLAGRALQCPVVFDWEEVNDENARTATVGGALLTQIADAFCNTVQAAGYQPMIYLNRHMAYRRFDLSALTAWPVWLASYENDPQYYYTLSYWQYTSKGTVAGIGKQVDLNLRMPQA